LKRINYSPQSKRLNIFKQLTGYSTLEFGKQCGIPSSATMQLIIVQGKFPSNKVLNKIIKRFPQLNYDWVVLGHGEMILEDYEKKFPSDNSVNISNESAFEQILSQLNHQSIEINDLNNKLTYFIEKNKLDN
jgi:hypothetical protein